MPPRSKLTVRLPEDKLKFLRRFAAEHGLTMTEVLDRFLTRLREDVEERPIHPEVEAISGLIPSDVDPEGVYHEHLLRKHG